MTVCRVTAQVYSPDGSPWKPGPGAVLRYSLLKGSYNLSGNYPRRDVPAKIGVDGVAIVNLWVNEEGIEPTNWQVFFPNGESDIFSIPPGTTDATLEYLRLLSSTPNPGPPSLGAAINAAIAVHNANPAAHPGLGGGGPGGVGLNEIHFNFYAGDAVPVNLGAPFTGLLAAVRVCVEDAFTGLLRFEIGSDFYEFPSTEVACYEFSPARRCINEQPRLLMSGRVAGETGNGFVQLIKSIEA